MSFNHPAQQHAAPTALPALPAPPLPPRPQWGDRSTADVLLRVWASRDAPAPLATFPLHLALLVDKSKYLACLLPDAAAAAGAGSGGAVATPQEPHVLDEELGDAGDVAVYAAVLRMFYVPLPEAVAVSLGPLLGNASSPIVPSALPLQPGADAAASGGTGSAARPELLGVQKVLEALVLAVRLQFDAAVSACLQFLESVPWSPSETRIIHQSLRELQLAGSIPFSAVTASAAAGAAAGGGPAAASVLSSERVFARLPPPNDPLATLRSLLAVAVIHTEANPLSRMQEEARNAVCLLLSSERPGAGDGGGEGEGGSEWEQQQQRLRATAEESGGQAGEDGELPVIGFEAKRGALLDAFVGLVNALLREAQSRGAATGAGAIIRTYWDIGGKPAPATLAATTAPVTDISLLARLRGKEGTMAWLVAVMLEYGLADEVFHWLSTDKRLHDDIKSTMALQTTSRHRHLLVKTAVHGVLKAFASRRLVAPTDLRVLFASIWLKLLLHYCLRYPPAASSRSGGESGAGSGGGGSAAMSAQAAATAQLLSTLSAGGAGKSAGVAGAAAGAAGAAGVAAGIAAQECFFFCHCECSPVQAEEVVRGMNDLVSTLPSAQQEALYAFWNQGRAATGAFVPASSSQNASYGPPPNGWMNLSRAYSLFLARSGPIWQPTAAELRRGF
ncbi:hypothetical protein CLOM_g11901 [Closterium sp. NIES-68]|nr:hypothetical protein CLOM_g11901 [Closterium sp. NIES-68]